MAATIEHSPRLEGQLKRSQTMSPQTSSRSLRGILHSRPSARDMRPLSRQGTASSCERSTLPQLGSCPGLCAAEGARTALSPRPVIKPLLLPGMLPEVGSPRRSMASPSRLTRPSSESEKQVESEGSDSDSDSDSDAETL
eukprot:GGOE01008525.1.p4 GENE.GGOE01008525.1~~GGOE01008525.1.p4  ORF type:complete len:163 (-),score=27.43 GGOE01008525.1:1834-2253(-)